MKKESFARCSPTPPLPSQVYEDLLLPLAVMSEVIRILLALPQPVRDTVCLRHTGMTYREIAAETNTTIDLAEKRHRRAMAKYPALKALFPVKAAKQNRRRLHRQKRTPPIVQ
ncbi:MAG: hypothetical protein K8T26_12365 [Lentisphaerae bacterium]|nr:hypothetical protein [Lentisphaerota bacterium]